MLTVLPMPVGHCAYYYHPTYLPVHCLPGFYSPLHLPGIITGYCFSAAVVMPLVVVDWTYRIVFIQLYCTQFTHIATCLPTAHYLHLPSLQYLHTPHTPYLQDYYACNLTLWVIVWTLPYLGLYYLQFFLPVTTDHACHYHHHLPFNTACLPAPACANSWDRTWFYHLCLTRHLHHLPLTCTACPDLTCVTGLDCYLYCT